MKIKLFSGREAKNASWIIGGRVAQMILSFFVGILTARYLGPGNYGLISYATAFITFFTALCNLGLNSVIVKEFIDHPDEQGEAIGSAIVMRAASSLLCAVMITGLVSIIDREEPITIAVVALSSIGLVFHVFGAVSYWFQAQYKSKIPSIATLIGYIAVSAYKIFLLATGKDVRWFAFANTVDYIVVAIILLWVYKKSGGPRLSFSWKKSKALLSVSYHYILSSLMVSIYGQSDKLMLKHMVDESEVGYYAVAVALCNMWTFVLSAIIESLYPTILSFYKEDRIEEFENKNRQLYCIVFYVSAFVSLGFTFFGGFAIKLLYGSDFASSVEPLKIITWYTAFSFLGVARNAWVVCKKAQKYLKFMYGAAVTTNVLLNLFFIPLWGASGAALASLITEISTGLVFPLFVKALRPNVKLMLEGISFKGILWGNKSKVVEK